MIVSMIKQANYSFLFFTGLKLNKSFNVNEVYANKKTLGLEKSCS